jgi:DNA polymerase-3 subunit beta
MTTTTKTQRGGTRLKFSVGELKAAFSTVRDGVPSRPSRPVLANVLLGADETLTATDLEVRITCPLAGATGPAVLLPHARVTQILGSCDPSAEVSLQVDDASCCVECDGGKWVLPTSNAAEFPAGHDGIGRPISRLPADQFVTMMDNVRFAVDEKTGRAACAGVLIEFTAGKGDDDGTLSLVATDGRRLCCSQCEVSQDLDDSKTFVPDHGIDVLCKLAAGREVVQLETAGNELLANIDGVVVQVRLLDGAMLDWRRVLPERDVAPSRVGVSSLLRACQMAAVCVSESSKGAKFKFGDGRLRLAAKSAERGASSAAVSLLECGTPCEVVIDPTFAIEWLSSLDPAAGVEIEVENSESKVLMRCDDAFTVIMPLFTQEAT